ncbi:MAG: sarcosine oxidase subunit alpha family protein [Alphaproteobacteria bacterium]|nr:sarcosine oxidase subunit alpha family protein [Alphaproteobacteria bacterium]
MSASYRISGGSALKRERTVRFRFDGRDYVGHQGDTLASALLANGVGLFGRSFKYHRPRGIVSAGAEEPNALVGAFGPTGGFTPNLRATQVELFDGLVAESQNRWPSLDFDVGAINNWLSPLFMAGFYYKTFMGPKAAGGNWVWRQLFEPAIRAAAGLGSPPTEPDPDRYASMFAYCDLLVIGGGAAGLAAAETAANSGAQVILCDEQAEFGGWLLSEAQAEIEGRAARDWAADVVARLRGRDNVQLLTRTQAFGYFPHDFVGLCETIEDAARCRNPALPRERLWQVRAGRVVVATGAIERPLVFVDNDRPGIMLAGAAQTYLQRWGVMPGRRIVLFTACDSAYPTALALAEAGGNVVELIDLRSNVAEALSAPLRARNIAVSVGAAVTGSRGGLRLNSVEIRSVDRNGQTGAMARQLACDTLLMSGGWTPSVHLHSQARGKVAWSEEAKAFLPVARAGGPISAGACAGKFGLRAAIRSGADAALAALGAPPTVDVTPAVAEPALDLTGMVGRVPFAGDPRRGKAFVDFQNDVSARDLLLANQEGMVSIEHVKRFTTTGMATDQGKTSNLNALAIVASNLGKPVPAVGLTTFRMPYTPVSFGSFAGIGRGDQFDPIRRTPIDGWAQAQGAVFEDVGTWKRARYFPKPGEDMHQAVARECRTVRQSVGMLDASTLGKIEVVGPDAAEFLERMYVNSWRKLAPGRCRYGIMLNEAGYVIDDGVIARVAPDRFHVTTTTGGAPRVLHMMEDYLQTEWPDLKVWLTSTTEQWAVIAVQGPKAREVLAPLIEGVDLAPKALSHMAYAEGRICGVKMKLFRVSFTGELGYEVNVPADYGRAVWEAIWEQVEKYGGCAYGTESLHVLRAEKGFIIVGQETDGTVTPDDVGLSWAFGKGKGDFVGKRSLSRTDLAAAGRPQMVGLLTDNPAIVLEEGAQIVAMVNAPIGTEALGHVTSAYYSSNAGRSIALALVADGRNRLGTKLHVPMPGGSVSVTLVEPVFVDPKGERVNG